MRPPFARKWLAILWAAALPPPASAIDWSSRIGFGWSQQDDWSPAVHDRSPLMLLDLGLKLRQVVSRPEVAWVRGGATYRLYDRQVNGVQVERTDTYTYDLAAALFQHRGSPLIVSASAARVVDDLSGAEGSLGSLTGDSGTVAARLALPGRPQVSLGYGWNLSSSRFPVLPDHDRTLQRLDAGAAHSTPAFNFNATYGAEWSRGNWLGDDYTLNDVRAEASANLGGATTFQISDQYYQRTPTASFDLALSSELHALQAGVRHLAGTREEQYGRYVYSHGIQTVPSLPATETTRHQGEYWREHRLGDSAFSARPTVSFSAAVQRLGADETRTTGETASALLRWYRESAGAVDEILGGPSFGLLQDTSASDAFGYGGSLLLGTARPVWGVQASARYEIAYGNDLNAVRGWSLTQRASLTGSGRLGPGALGGQLQLTAGRAHSPLFGEFASRNVSLLSQYGTARSRIAASLTVGSGIAGGPKDGFVGDGLLLPAPFDSHATFANLVASTGALIGLSASAGLRFGNTNTPGQPALTQYGVDASIAYVFAAFSVSLEDRLTTYAYPSGRATTNLVMFRIQRSLGDSF